MSVNFSRVFAVVWRAILIATAAIGPAALPLSAQSPAPAGERVVELPPLMVEASGKAPTWLYADAGGFEVLSCCSRETTRDWIKTYQYHQQVLRVVVPEEFLAKMDVPAVHVLYNLDSKRVGSDAVLQELIKAEKRRSREQSQNVVSPGLLPSNERGKGGLPLVALGDLSRAIFAQHAFGRARYHCALRFSG